MQIGLESFWMQNLGKIMDVLQTKHQTIAGNISNINTPGYRRSYVDFHSELQEIRQEPAAAGTGVKESQVSGRMALETQIRSEIQKHEDMSSPVRADGNNVNMEHEMMELSQTSQVYKVLARLAAKDFKLARYVISGGR